MLKNFRPLSFIVCLVFLVALSIGTFPSFAQTTATPTPMPTPEPTPLALLRDETMWQDTSLLVTSSCTLPCWNGITPGKTSWNEALDIIENDPRAENLAIRLDNESAARVAEWQRVDGENCCQMVTLDGESLSLVFLRLAPDSVTVGDLIEVRGEPSYVVVSPYSEDEAIINLVYPELSTVIFALVAGQNEGVLRASSEVIGVLYIKPEDMELLLQTSSLNAWEGYQSYRYYDESMLEITPSITLTPTPRP